MQSAAKVQQWIGPLQDGKRFGFIDWNGKWTLQIECDDLGEFQEGLAPFVREVKIGFVDTTGSEVIKPQFTTDAIVLPPFRDGLAPVQFEGRSTFIDTAGEMIGPLRANTALWNFIDGKALTCTNGRFSIIDKAWKEISTLDVCDVPFHFNFPKDWNCFPCFADGDGCPAYINWKGEFIFHPIHHDLGRFVDGIAPFSPDGNSFGLVRINGEVILPPQFLQLYSLSEGLAAAQLEIRKWGFIDPSGNWVIQPKFMQALPFSDGLACVTLTDKDRRGKKGFINHTGDLVIPARYNRQASFHNGWAMVEFEGRIQVIDKTGGLILEL